MAASIKLSVDLVDAVQFQLTFLQEIDAARHLRQDCNLYLAIFRYEQLWLPLRRMFPKEEIEPPLDIAWIWHVHTLAPAAYLQDCKKIFGGLLSRSLFPPAKRQRALLNAQQIWAQYYPTYPFEFRPAAVGWTYKCCDITYDLFAATKRQSAFFYQVSLPHYRDSKFLKRTLQRYKQFLHLNRMNPNTFVVPTFDIDLMWHAHQAHPAEYAADCQKIFGHVLDHDDTDTDRGEGSKLKTSDTSTRELWRQTFGEKFAVDGVMWRGHSMRGQLAAMTLRQLHKVTEERFRVEINRVIISWQGRSGHVAGFAIRNSVDLSHPLMAKNIQGDFNTFYDTPSFELSIDELRNLICSVHVDDGAARKKAATCEATMDLALLVSTLSEEELLKHQEVVVQLKDDDGVSAVNLAFGVRMIPIAPSTISFQLNSTPFNDLTDSPKIASLYPHLGDAFSDPIRAGIAATHQLQVNLREVFKVRISHATQPLLSAVHVVNDQDKLLAYSHLISTEQLPLETTVLRECGDQLLCSLDERAMLVKDNRGDAYFIKGQWKKEKGSVSIYGSMAIPAGQMKYTITDMITAKTSVIKVASRSSSFHYDGITVDLLTGCIALDRPDYHQLPAQISLAFSLGILWTFCAPATKSASELTSLGVKSVGSNSLLFLSSVGFEIREHTPSNDYLSTQKTLGASDGALCDTVIVGGGACGGGGCGGAACGVGGDGNSGT